MTTVNTTALTVKPPTTTTPPRLRNLRTRSVSVGRIRHAGWDGFRVGVRREEWLSKGREEGRESLEERGGSREGFRDSWIQRGGEGGIVVARKRRREAGRKS